MVHTELKVPGKNHLIESLPEPERTRLVEKCDKLTLAAGSMLFQADLPIEAAYFPLTGMVSLVGTTQEGHAIEVGTVGNLGIAGGFIALGSDRSASAGMVQCSGDFLRIMVEDLRAELGRCRALNEIVQRFAHALTKQISQSLVCNQTVAVDGARPRRHRRARPDAGIHRADARHSAPDCYRREAERLLCGPTL
jgi:hypothetical protein